MHFHEKKNKGWQDLKKNGVSTILELHFEVILEKQVLDKLYIVVGGDR